MKPMKPKEEFASSLVKIPKFVKKEVASRSGRGFDFQTDYSLMAVTEEGNHEILAVVHPRYNLVQFSQIYKLATEKYENFSFLIDYFKGRGTLHIIPDNTDNTENEDKIGIVVDNSVDCSKAITIGFEIYTKSGLRVPIHSKFRKVHSADALTASSNYLQVIQKTREFWKSITTRMMNETATQNDFEVVKSGICLGEKKAKKLWHATVGDQNKKVTVWNLFESAIILLNERNYKTEWHRTHRLNLLRKVIQTYAVYYSIDY